MKNNTIKKCLVIGGAGFVGEYLIEQLFADDYEVHATKLAKEVISSQHCIEHDLDILDYNQTVSLLAEIKPATIVLLAAQSSVALSWEIPQRTVEINVLGPINILEAIRVLGIKTRLLLVGSSEQYGIVASQDIPITENHQTSPMNPYAISKTSQELFGHLYLKTFQLDVIFVRAFNHIGPKQTSAFVVSDFAKQIAEIEKGLKDPIIYVGNLEAKRDFTDVRDVAKAYVQILEKGRSGEIYNVGSGKATSISFLLNQLIELSTKEIEIRLDKERMRPSDMPIIEADTIKIKKEVGWSAEIDLKRSLLDTLNNWRDKINNNLTI